LGKCRNSKGFMCRGDEWKLPGIALFISPYEEKPSEFRVLPGSHSVVFVARFWRSISGISLAYQGFIAILSGGLFVISKVYLFVTSFRTSNATDSTSTVCESKSKFYRVCYSRLKP
jgi:hypothetical protein